LVIDDNSDADKVDFKTFPGLHDPQVEVVFTKEGRGAGYARNIGLDKAKGKWILFADADDYFNYCITDILPEYLHCDADIIYFKNRSIQLGDYTPLARNNWRNGRNAYINFYTKYPQKAELLLKYKTGMPWGKMIKKSLIDNNKIKFEELSFWEDVGFSYMCGFFASKIRVDPRAIYTACLRNGSNQEDASTIEREKIWFYVNGRLAFFLKDNHIPLYVYGRYLRRLTHNKFKNPAYYEQTKNIFPSLGYTGGNIFFDSIKSFAENFICFNFKLFMYMIW
jgi:glycosyltransferase involved in cell wall biosynthesis